MVLVFKIILATLFELARARPQTSEVQSCADIEFDGFRCVPPNLCRNAICLGEELVDYRSGLGPEDTEIDCREFQHNAKLSFECLGLRNAASNPDKQVCCHQENIIEETVSSKDTEPSDCASFEHLGYTCISAVECIVPRNFDDSSVDLRTVNLRLEPTEESAPVLNKTCLGLRSGALEESSEMVCCHENFKATVERELQEPAEGPDCASFEHLGYNCVPRDECLTSRKLEEAPVDQRTVTMGIETTEELDPVLNKTCLGLRSGALEDSGEMVCCHESFVSQEPITPDKSETPQQQEEPDCASFEYLGYSCVLAMECLTPRSFKESSVDLRSGALELEPTEEIAPVLNKTCLGLRSEILENSSEMVCCHENFIDKEPKAVTTTKSTPKCGRRNNADSSDESQISRFGEWPFVCAIFRRNSPFNFIAGSSLITPGVLLTTAHWIDDLSPEQLVVRCGDWDISSTDEPEPFVERNVEFISTHPRFDLKTARYDYGLLHLESEFNLSTNIDTLCLPYDNKYDDHCFAAGWGKDSVGDHSTLKNKLRHVELPLQTNKDCEAALQVQYGDRFSLHESFLCAGGKQGEDTCRGDGGGPLFCRIQNSDSYTQVGITAWGYECGLPNIPGVYASLEFGKCYIDFMIKCRHGDKYKEYIDADGCNDWLQSEVESYLKRKAELDDYIQDKSFSNEQKKENARKESKKLGIAIEKIQKLKEVCENVDQTNNLFVPRKGETN